LKEKSFILDRKIAEKAVQIVLPSILEAMKSGIVKRKALSICILNPQESDIILYQYDIGNKKKWKYPFDKIALSKACTAMAKKKDTSYIIERKPWVLGPGHSIYSGGVYFQGIVIGVSGVEEYFDEMFAKWIVHTIKALCLERFKKVKELIEEKGEHSIPLQYDNLQRMEYIPEEEK